MGDRNAAKRCLLPRPVVRLVVVGICLLFRVSTAGQADPKLALIEAIRQAGRESGAAAFLQQIEAADALVPSADMQGYGDVSRPAEQGWLGMDYGDLSLFAGSCGRW